MQDANHNSENRDSSGEQKALTEQSFEESFAKLSQAIKLLESGTLPLEKALVEFELGIKAAATCSAALVKVEQQVEVLMKTNQGVQSMPLKPQQEA